ncbi:MAG: hypothetical protein ACTSU5_14980 [Promethearchaeota archaeon]
MSMAIPLAAMEGIAKRTAFPFLLLGGILIVTNATHFRNFRKGVPEVLSKI